MNVTGPATTTTFIKLRPAEVRVFRRKKRLPGPVWMERNVYVPVGSRQGLYRNANNPAMYGVLDWSTRFHVRVVVMAKGIQVGGTLVFYGLLLREGEYSSDNALIVMADEKTVRKLIKKRLQPMIDKSAALSAIKSADPDDTTMYSITLAHGFAIDAGWASSEMSVSSESYRIVILDEISKYKTRGNIEDAKARTTVYGESKRIWIFSSPGIDTDDPNNRDPLMVEAEACDMMLEFFAVCPDCGSMQVMRFDQFKWPGQVTLDGALDADPKTIRRTRSAWYECEHCGSHWNDWKRDKALIAAMKDGWQPTGGEDIEFPQSVYFHFPSWLSPYVSLSDVAADWLEAQGDEEKLRKWYNRHAGVSYKVIDKNAPELDGLADRAEAYAPTIPMGAGMLTAGADVQADRIELEVLAWGMHNETWGMDYQVFYGDTSLPDVWQQLDEYLLRPWRHESGEDLRVERCFIDAGYRDYMVHRFTGRRNGRGVFSSKGAKDYNAPEIQGPVLVKQGAARVRQYSVGTQKIKSLMFGYLALPSPGPRYCHVPDSYPENWYTMLQTEHQVTIRHGGNNVYVWKKKSEAGRNEAIDCRVYAIAAYMSIRNNDMKDRLARMKERAAKESEKVLPVNTNKPYRPGGFVKGW